jgi:hypothetical protein
MKRYWLIALAALVFTAVAYARSSGSSITVTPQEMKNGDTKTFTDDGTTITLRRDGDSIDVKIDGAGDAKHLTITRADGDITIDRDGIKRMIVIGPDRFQFNTVPHAMPKIAKSQTWYVCPKDHTMMRVPEGKDSDTFKCPVDGTTMEKRKGHGFTFFFDDDLLNSEAL